MDNIQFWIYVIFAIIYFVARNFKKGDKKNTNRRPQQSADQPDAQTPQPQSFEELLEEITGRRSVSQKREEVTEVEEPEPFADAFDERYLQPKPWEEKEEEIQRANEFEKEGRNRQFADEESKKIYEESIKRAEGASLDYSLDKNFASKKVLRETAEEVEVNPLAIEIRNMLTNPDDTRKAIILSEILNRKY